MTAKTTTEVYSVRLPAPTVIRGSLALRDSQFDLSRLTSGCVLDDQTVDLPRKSDTSEIVDDQQMVVHDVIMASPTRAYVLTSGPWAGWWRIDTTTATRPEPSEIVGELTPVPDTVMHVAIRASDLRIDDMIYASGLPQGRQARILDIVPASMDGRDPSLLLRTEFGWYVWRRPFVHVAAL